MAEEWFYSQNGQQAGPVDFGALQRMAAAGQLHPSDLVWKQGMANWAAAGSVGGVFAAPPPPVPPPPVPPPYAAPPPPQYSPPPGYAGQGTYPAPPMNYAPPPGYAQPVAKNYASMAKSAMICSLVGLVIAPGLLGLLAVIYGGMSMSGMSKTGDPRGKGMAVTALVIGIVDLVVALVLAAAFQRYWWYS